MQCSVQRSVAERISIELSKPQIRQAKTREAKDTLVAELASLEEERATLVSQLDTANRTATHLAANCR